MVKLLSIRKLGWPCLLAGAVDESVNKQVRAAGLLLASGGTVVVVLVAVLKRLIRLLWVTVDAHEIDDVVARIPLIQIRSGTAP
jgi:hypothetical protein